MCSTLGQISPSTTVLGLGLACCAGRSDFIGPCLTVMAGEIQPCVHNKSRSVRPYSTADAEVRSGSSTAAFMHSRVHV